MFLRYAIWRGNHSEGILLGLARYIGAGSATSIGPDNTIENKNRHSVLLSFNYIPDLSERSAGRASPGKPSRKRGTDLGVDGVPPFRSSGSYVLEAPFGGERAHRPCAKHVKDSQPTNDQRQPCEHWKILE